jgi:hypothetical protein
MQPKLKSPEAYSCRFIAYVIIIATGMLFLALRFEEYNKSGKGDYRIRSPQIGWTRNA